MRAAIARSSAKTKFIELIEGDGIAPGRVVQEARQLIHGVGVRINELEP